MKKIACLSALAAVLAFSAGSAVASTSTVTGGYAQSDAQSDAQGAANKMNGFNLKYRYEQDNNPLGVIGSFTYTEKIVPMLLATTTKPNTTASLQVLLTV